MRNIKHYLINLLAILFFLIANHTIFAIEYGQEHRSDISKTGIYVENVNLFLSENGKVQIENSGFEKEGDFVGGSEATGNAATAYFQKNGAYVVKDNVTNEVIQISNILDPNWIPDATIINPFIPN